MKKENLAHTYMYEYIMNVKKRGAWTIIFEKIMVPKFF